MPLLAHRSRAVQDDLHRDLRIVGRRRGRGDLVAARRTALAGITLLTSCGTLVAFVAASFGGFAPFADVAAADWTPAALWGAAAAGSFVAWALVD